MKRLFKGYQTRVDDEIAIKSCARFSSPQKSIKLIHWNARARRVSGINCRLRVPRERRLMTTGVYRVSRLKRSIQIWPQRRLTKRVWREKKANDSILFEIIRGIVRRSTLPFHLRKFDCIIAFKIKKIFPSLASLLNLKIFFTIYSYIFHRYSPQDGSNSLLQCRTTFENGFERKKSE